MRAVTRNSVGILTDTQFDAYVVNRTRDYDMVLLFSYTQDRTVCPTCRYGLNCVYETQKDERRLRENLPSVEGVASGFSQAHFLRHLCG